MPYRKNEGSTYFKKGDTNIGGMILGEFTIILNQINKGCTQKILVPINCNPGIILCFLFKRS